MALAELRVTGLAVIREARLVPGAGFTALTGETGAGKSVCIAALRLALGGRPEAELVRPGTDAARVAAVFDAVPRGLEERLAGLGVPDGDVLTLSRELPGQGRAVARINGALVSQGTLREVGEALVEVTLQGASQRLLSRTWQREMLDASGGAAVRQARLRMAAAHERWRRAEEQLAAAAASVEREAAELADARELVADLGPLRLRPGEEEELVEERARLRHAAGIAAAAQVLRSACSGGEDGAGAADLVAAALREGRDVLDADRRLRALGEAAAAIVAELRDTGEQARRLLEELPADEGRLAGIEERLDGIGRVRRRFGGVEEALRALAQAEELISAAEDAGAGIERLERETVSARDEAAVAAGALSSARREAAACLEEEVEARLRLLGMEHARFRVVLGTAPDEGGVELDGDRVACAPHGADLVELRLAADPAAPPLPLGDGPSGGELSRLALALGSLAAPEPCPTLVLDEVDAGIGGETAARVGEVLAAMGSSRQVIAVTHRPEIAARASDHLVAVKRTGSSGPETSVEALEGDRRVEEVARLMSGRTTAAALRRAGELLDEGRPGACARRPPVESRACGRGG